MNTAAHRERWSETFPPEATAVRAARHFVIDSPAVSGVDLAVLEMVVSELASNAVLHARTAFVVAFERLADGVRVDVRDGSAVWPRVRPIAPSNATGRGMLIVESVVRRWGVEPAPDGKTVWFEIGWTPAPSTTTAVGGTIGLGVGLLFTALLVVGGRHSIRRAL